jgi:ribosomal protein S6
MENRKLTYSLMKQSKGHFILYVTFSDLNKLEPEVQDHEEFESLKKFLESNGFLHMLMMAFRSNSHKLKVKDIVEIMKEGGYERNKSVENFL